MHMIPGQEGQELCSKYQLLTDRVQFLPLFLLELYQSLCHHIHLKFHLENLVNILDFSLLKASMSWYLSSLLWNQQARVQFPCIYTVFEQKSSQKLCCCVLGQGN